ncbi:MAG TPA: hypothetical protein VGA70_12140 [Longimicrobiales bacterium]
MTPRRWILAVFAAAGLLIAAPDAALACAVCFDPRDENRMAFLATTAFLSLLPLGMVGGMGFWLWRKVRVGDAAQDDLAPDATGDAPGSGPATG